MSDIGKMVNKRSLSHTKPYDRPWRWHSLSQLGEKIRNAILPSFLLYSKQQARTEVQADTELDSTATACQTTSPQIEVEVDGYVASFDRSIVNDDVVSHGANTPSQSANNANYHDTLTDQDDISSAAKRIRLEADDACTSTAQRLPRFPAKYDELSKQYSLVRGKLSSSQTGMFERRSVDQESFLWSNNKPAATAVAGCGSSGHTDLSNTAAIGSKPAFTEGTLEKVRDESTALSRSSQESPFYRGRTTYGGAAAYQRCSGNSPYQLVSSVKQPVRVKTVGDGSSGVTSSTAKRILDVLERTESDHEQSKLTSLNLSAVDSPLPMSIYQRQSLRCRSAASQKAGPPVKLLMTPTENALSRNRSVFNVVKQVTSTRQPASSTTSVQSQPTTQSVTAAAAAVSGGGGKMKRDHSKHYSIVHSHGHTDESFAPAYELPTSITLPVLNSFSPLGVGGPLTSQSSFTFSEPIAVVSQERTVEFSSVPTSFSFQSPLLFDSMISTPATVCSSPLTASTQPATVAPISTNSIISTSISASPKKSLADFKFDTSSAVKRKSVDGETIVKSKSSDVMAGSVLDVLGKSSLTSQELASTAQPLRESTKTSDYCQTSSGDLLGSDSTAVPITINQPSLSEMFCRPADEWTCSVCCIFNKLSSLSCIACQAPNPHAAKAAAENTINSVTTSSQLDSTLLLADNKTGSGVDLGGQTTFTSGFKFGTSVTQSGTTVEPTNVSGFSFGLGSQAQSTTSGGFKFGASSLSQAETNVEPIGAGSLAPETGTNAKTTGSGGFKFGAGTSIEPQSTGSGTVKLVSSVSFETSVSQPGTKPAESSTGGFKFGQPVKLTSASFIQSSVVSSVSALSSITSIPAANLVSDAKPAFTFTGSVSAVASCTQQSSTSTFSFGSQIAASPLSSTTVSSSQQQPTTCSLFTMGSKTTAANVVSQPAAVPPAFAASMSPFGVFGSSTSKPPVVLASLANQPTAFNAITTSTSQLPSFGHVTSTGQTQMSSNAASAASGPQNVTTTVTSTNTAASLFTFGSSSFNSSGRGLGVASTTVSQLRTNSNNNAIPATSATCAMLGSVGSTPTVSMFGIAANKLSNVQNSSSVFNFGSSNNTLPPTTTSAMNSSTVFGQPAALNFCNPASTQSTGVPLFGAPTQSAFGQTSSSSVFNPLAPAATFAFGQMPTSSAFCQSSSAPFGSAVTSAGPFGGFVSSTPAFGAAAGVTAPAAPAFGFSQSATATSSGFSLGKRSSTAEIDEQNKRKLSGFGGFGGQSSGHTVFGAGAQSSVTTFGAAQPNTVIPPQPNVFSFGASSQPVAPSPFGSQPPAANSASTVPNFSLTPSFQFTGTAQQPANLFQFGGQDQSNSSSMAAAPAARVIKKATRKLNRK